MATVVWINTIPDSINLTRKNMLMAIHDNHSIIIPADFQLYDIIYMTKRQFYIKKKEMVYC